MVEGTAAGKYASQLLKASCASYAKGLAPHALCQVSPTKLPIHWRHGIKNVKTWIKESMSPMKQPIHWRQARYTSDRLRFFHSAGHRSCRIRQPAAQSGRRSYPAAAGCSLQRSTGPFAYRSRGCSARFVSTITSTFAMKMHSML